VFYLLPEFIILAFACAVGALCLANHVLGRQTYVWRIVGQEKGRVRASCGVVMGCEVTVAMERHRLRKGIKSSSFPSMVVACAGLHVERYINRAGEAWLRECRQSGMADSGFCSGLALLARAGLLESDYDIHTCAGGIAF